MSTLDDVNPAWPRHCVGEEGIVYEIDVDWSSWGQATFYDGIHLLGWPRRHIFCTDNFRGESIMIKGKNKNPDGTREKIEKFIPPHLHPCDKDGVVVPQLDRPVKWPWMTVIDKR